MWPIRSHRGSSAPTAPPCARCCSTPRESVVCKVEGVTDADARWSPVPSGTSLLWLVEHPAEAETPWFVRR